MRFSSSNSYAIGRLLSATAALALIFAFASVHTTQAQHTTSRYYCDESNAFYPQIQECKSGWRTVQAREQEQVVWRLYTIICEATPCYGSALSDLFERGFESEADCRSAINTIPASHGYKHAAICVPRDLTYGDLADSWFDTLVRKWGSTPPALPDNPPPPPYPPGPQFRVRGESTPLAVLASISAPVWIDWAQVDRLCADHGYDCGMAGAFKAIRDRGMVPNTAALTLDPVTHDPPSYVPPGVVVRLGSNGWPAAVIPFDGGPVWIDWAHIAGNCINALIIDNLCHGAGFFLAISVLGMTK